VKGYFFPDLFTMIINHVFIHYINYGSILASFLPANQFPLDKIPPKKCLIGYSVSFQRNVIFKESQFTLQPFLQCLQAAILGMQDQLPSSWMGKY